MTSVEEFVAARISIETLVAKIAQSVGSKAVQGLKENFEEASRQLEVLRTMVANEVQEIVEGRLSRQLAELGPKVDTITAKAAAKKTVEKKAPKKSPAHTALD